MKIRIQKLTGQSVATLSFRTSKSKNAFYVISRSLENFLSIVLEKCRVLTRFGLASTAGAMHFNHKRKKFP